MVRPSQELSVIALTDAQTIAIGDGVDTGDDGMDLDGGGSNPGTVTTPPDVELLEVIADSGDAVEIDFNTANWWDITLTADCTLTIVNPPPSGSIGLLHIILRQGTGAPWLVTWPLEVEWPDIDGTDGGSAPTLFTVETARDFVELVTEDGGTSYGGTHATTSAGSLDTTLVTVAASGTTETIDVSVARTYDVTLSANCTLTLTGAIASEAWYLTLMLRQDATGNRTVTWPGSVIWPGGVTPTLSTTGSAVDVFELFTLDGGTVWFGFPTAGAAAASPLTVKDEGTNLDTAVTSLNFVGSGVTATNVSHAVTVTIPTATSAAIAALGFAGEILISDTPAGSPLVFADLLQNEAQDDLIYADPL